MPFIELTRADGNDDSILINLDQVSYIGPCDDQFNTAVWYSDSKAVPTRVRETYNEIKQLIMDGNLY